MDATTDNPQETHQGLLTDYTRRTQSASEQRDSNDLSWLGGILDGEGTFGLSHVKKPHTRRGYFMLPYVSVGNTNFQLIEEVARICRDNSLAHCVSSSSVPKSRYKCKPAKRLNIQGIRRVNKALNVLLPYVRSKQPVAQAVKSFCEYRLNVVHQHPYGEVEDGLRAEILRLNRKGVG